MGWKGMVRAALLALAAALLPSAGCEGGDVGRGDELAQVTVRASITLDGAQPSGANSHPSLSGDGRFVVFASAAINLTPNDSNSFQDIFLKDRLTGEIQNLTLYIVPPSFAQYNPHDCYDPMITRDGRYVAFRTRGNYWPAPSLGGVPPLKPYSAAYRYDRVLKEFRGAFLKTLDPNADMLEPSVSGDGRYILFVSAASNLTAVNPGGWTQVWVFDTLDESTRLVSRGPTPATPADRHCVHAALSGDGRYAVFESTAMNLTAEDTHSLPQAYIADLTVNPITVVPLAYSPTGVFANLDSSFPSISEDGRYVAFYSSSSNLLPGAATTTPRIYRKDRTTGGLELVTDVPGIQRLPAAIFPPPCLPLHISGDGRSVGFLSGDGTLYPGYPLLFYQVFVKDMEGGGTVMASRHLDGTPSNLDCAGVALSHDGRWVAWETLGSTLVDGDTNGVPDIYLRGPLR